MSTSALLSRSASQCTTSSAAKCHKTRNARVAFANSRPTAVHVRASEQADTVEPAAVPRRSVLASGAILSAAAAASSLTVPQPAQANLVLSSDWEKVELPVDPKVVLLDIGFTGSDPNHGFLLGTKQTLLETFNGGKTWEPRTIQTSQDEGFNYRFSSISFSGDEGWIVGKPAILLHTSDGGKNWKRIPLSSKLPGSPLLIQALPGAAGQAEMTTDQGAIYVTDNTAYTWTAAVQETVDATLNRTVSSGISGASFYEGYFANVARNNNGEYVAVSSRGNFYMTWAPGQAYWMPHNRPAARRIQNMGWTSDNQMWLTTRGGDLLVSPETGVTEKFEQAKVSSRGFGLLDVGFKGKDLGFAVGGSGTLYKTEDGGKSWKRDKSTETVPGNLYEVKFFPGGNGFVLGNDGILLRYIGTA